jgi:hypothetical protein
MHLVYHFVGPPYDACAQLVCHVNWSDVHDIGIQHQLLYDTSLGSI